jgi:hypothetical protein
MKLYATCVLAAAILCFNAAAMRAQNCAIDEGNMCQAQCGQIADTCYDLAAPDSGGNFESTQSIPSDLNHALGTGSASTTVHTCRIARTPNLPPRE